MKRISRNQQKLLWWMITDYAKHLSGNTIVSSTSEFWKYKAKLDIIKRYKATQSELEGYVPFQSLRWEGTKTADEARDILLEELQLILLTNEAMLSLSQHLMSNERAVSLTGFIFDFFLENEIEMRKEIRDLYKEQQAAKYTIAHLKNRKCIMSGELGADIHHIEHQSSGKNVPYWEDLLCLPLSREWHGIFHSKSNKDLIERYHLTPVPFKLAIGVYTYEEIQKEIAEHKNPKLNSDYKK